MVQIQAAASAGRRAQAFSLYTAVLEGSLDTLASAGMAYPYEYRFRSAQAKALASAASRFPDLQAAAVQGLTYAIAIDPNEAELLGMLVLMQARSGQCEAARISGQRLRVLAPKSKKVDTVLASIMECVSS